MIFCRQHWWIERRPAWRTRMIVDIASHKVWICARCGAPGYEIR